MARQPLSKYLPTKYGGGLFVTESDINSDDPAAVAGEAFGRVLSRRDVQLTNAQVLALFATPQVLIAAPGAGLAILVDHLYVVSDSAAGAYTESIGQDVELEYADGTNILTIDNTGLFTTGNVQRRVFEPGALADAIAGLAPVANSAVRLFKTVAEFGGGNAANTVSIRIYYHIVETAAFS